MLKPQEVTAASAMSLGRSILAYASLFKLRIVWLLLFVSFASALLAARGLPGAQALALLLLTGAMAASGSGALNHYLEQDIDPLMGRTLSRPLVTGQIARPEIALWLGILLIGASVTGAAFLNLSLAFFLFLGAFVYVVVYTMWLKRRGPSNIVVGGIAGSCAVLSGWAVVGSWLSLEPLLLALLLFLWTPAHFWSLALFRVEDYRRAGVPMLPVVSSQQKTGRWVLVYAVLVTATSLGLAFTGSFGWLYVGTAIAAGSAFTGAALALSFFPSERLARLNFWISLIYLVGIFAGIMMDVQVF